MYFTSLCGTGRGGKKGSRRYYCVKLLVPSGRSYGILQAKSGQPQNEQAPVPRLKGEAVVQGEQRCTEYRRCPVGRLCGLESTALGGVERCSWVGGLVGPRSLKRRCCPSALFSPAIRVAGRQREIHTQSRSTDWLGRVSWGSPP